MQCLRLCEAVIGQGHVLNVINSNPLGASYLLNKLIFSGSEFNDNFSNYS